MGGCSARFQPRSGIVGTYNRANALARLGEYESAINLYAGVLDQQPTHEDAAFNKALVERLLEQQQQQQQSEEQQNESENQQQQQDSESQQSQSNDQEQQSDQQTSEADADPSEQQQQEQDLESDNQDQQRQELVNRDEKQEALEQWLRRVLTNQAACCEESFSTKPNNDCAMATTKIDRVKKYGKAPWYLDFAASTKRNVRREC